MPCMARGGARMMRIFPRVLSPSRTYAIENFGSWYEELLRRAREVKILSTTRVAGEWTGIREGQACRSWWPAGQVMRRGELERVRGVCRWPRPSSMLRDGWGTVVWAWEMLIVQVWVCGRDGARTSQGGGCSLVDRHGCGEVCPDLTGSAEIRQKLLTVALYMPGGGDGCMQDERGVDMAPRLGMMGLGCRRGLVVMAVAAAGRMAWAVPYLLI